MNKLIYFVILLTPFVILGACSNGNSQHEISGKVSIETPSESKPEWESLGTITATSYSKMPWDKEWKANGTFTGTLYSKDNGKRILYQIRTSDKEYAVSRYSGEFNYNASFSTNGHLGTKIYYFNVPSW